MPLGHSSTDELPVNDDPRADWRNRSVRVPNQTSYRSWHVPLWVSGGGTVPQVRASQNGVLHHAAAIGRRGPNRLLRVLVEELQV